MVTQKYIDDNNLQGTEEKVKGWYPFIYKGTVDELCTLHSHRIVDWSKEPRRRYRVKIESTTINTVVQEVLISATSKAEALKIADMRDPEDSHVLDIEFLSDTVKSTIGEHFLGVEEA